MRLLRCVASSLVVALILQSSAWPDVRPSAEAGVPAIFHTQALTLPAFWFRRTDHRLPKQTAVVLHSAVTQGAIPIIGASWFFRDYVEMMRQVLETLSHDPSYYLQRIKRLRFVPPYRGMGNHSEDLDLSKPAPEEIVLVTHWHPGVFLYEALYKITAATRRSATEESVLLQSWTLTTEKPDLKRVLWIQLAATALVASVLDAAAVLAAWPGLGGGTVVLWVSLMVAAQGLISYVGKGLVRRAISAARGKATWVLDPAKPAPWRPVWALGSPAHYVIAMNTPPVAPWAPTRTFYRPMAFLFSGILHVAVMLRLFPTEESILLLLVSGALAVWIFFLTETRLLMAGGSPRLVDAPQRRRGRIFRSIVQILWQTAHHVQRNLKWGIPLMGVLMLVNPQSREVIVQNLRDVQEEIREITEPPQPLDTTHYVRIYDPAVEETAQPGQEGTAKLTTPPDIVRHSPWTQALQGRGGRRVFPWDQPYVYVDVGNSRTEYIAHPFKMSPLEAEKSPYASTKMRKYISGPVIGIRLNVRESDSGVLFINIHYFDASGHYLERRIKRKLPDWHPRVKGQNQPYPLDIQFKDEDFNSTPLAPFLTGAPSLDLDIASSVGHHAFRFELKNMTVYAAPAGFTRRYPDASPPPAPPAPKQAAPRSLLDRLLNRLTDEPTESNAFKDPRHASPKIEPFPDADGTRTSGSPRELLERWEKIPSGAKIPIALYVDPVTDLPGTRVVTKAELRRLIERGEVSYSPTTDEWVWHDSLTGEWREPASPAGNRRSVLARAT